MPYTYLTIFLFNDSPTTEIYTLSLHDALPISLSTVTWRSSMASSSADWVLGEARLISSPRTMLAKIDRKSTRLNSSHQIISYAVFCLKKKKHSTFRHTRYQFRLQSCDKS